VTTPKKDNDPAAKRRPTLYHRADGAFDVIWPTRWLRFLLGDGRTIDVLTTRDDSDLREAIRREFKAETIIGCAELPPGGSPSVSAAARRPRAGRPVERPVDPPDGPQQPEPAHDE